MIPIKLSVTKMSDNTSLEKKWQLRIILQLRERPGWAKRLRAYEVTSQTTAQSFFARELQLWFLTRCQITLDMYLYKLGKQLCTPRYHWLSTSSSRCLSQLRHTRYDTHPDNVVCSLGRQTKAGHRTWQEGNYRQTQSVVLDMWSLKRWICYI